MALPPKFAGHKLQVGEPLSSPSSSSGPAVPPATHTLEVYLDYVCPFSAKFFKTLTTTVVPLLRDGGKAKAPLAIIFRQQIQPWHPSSTLVHEAALAVLRLRPAAFWSFSAALFDHQAEYFDVGVVKETRNVTYRRLADLAAATVGDGLTADDVYNLLAIPEKAAPDGSSNWGNKVTPDVKTITKMNRLVGIHVTPTVVYDGVVAGDISSSWGADQWEKWLGENLV
ncbi:hypothetical protein GMORB2_3740 [Geosmithia morbida]|uniref:Thioredoxin-like fold domain-containing protein n=1 Tax=Geosmithia morbida TaxID=1094350 RepID=A0A9P4Z001_9HYPO|nr:uncharacterized protein GMORB2_3740 [Geosmithia morbida]KAF4124901.1 hypothetical protein GMORB2_3740 [Geosmithia morbida]